MTEPVAAMSEKPERRKLAKALWVEAVIWDADDNGNPVEVTRRAQISRPASGDYDKATRAIATHKPEGFEEFEHRTKLEFLAKGVVAVDRSTCPGFPEGDVKKGFAEYFADEPEWIAAFFDAAGVMGSPKIFFR